MIRVGYMGIPFSNSAEMSVKMSAALGLEGVEHVALMSSRGVVDALMDGSIEYGVLAVENRFAGTVLETQKAMEGMPLEVLLLDWTPIHHCVFVKDGDVKVKKLISHVQALMQSQGNLRRLYPEAEFVECEDTAYAAEMLADGTIGPEYAAVCRMDAGMHYGLTMVHENVEDNKDNMTKFAIVRRV